MTGSTVLCVVFSDPEIRTLSKSELNIQSVIADKIVRGALHLYSVDTESDVVILDRVQCSFDPVFCKFLLRLIL